MRQLLTDFHASVEETLTRLLTAEEFLRDLTLDSSTDGKNQKKNGRHSIQQRQSSRLEQSTGDCVDGQQNAGKSDDEHSIDDIPIDELDSLLDHDVETVKSLFHRHYQFVCELNDFASKINDIFKEGQGLIRHPRNICTFEEKRTIESQIHLLNERYKRLLNKATDRQSKLHEALMILQKKEMDNLKAWLISAEDRLSTLVSIAHDIPAIFKQLEEYQELKKELDQQLDTVNSLSSCVVVVDEDDEEGRGDEATSDFEGQLNALSEKWSHVINFIDERGSILEHIINNYNTLLSEETKFNEWIEKLSKNLDEMEEMSRQEDIVNITSSSSPGTGVISELIRRLQSLEQDMESQHVHYSSIVDEGQKLLDFLENHSDAFEDVHNRLENLTQIWDQVVQRMENLGVALTKAAKRAQSKMTGTTNANLPYSTKPLPPSNIRPPSNVTATKTPIQSEIQFPSANQANFSTETQSSSSSTTAAAINNANGNKKIRLDSWRVKEWQRELENVSTWLGRIEDDLGLDDEGNGAVVWEELEVEEQQILLEDTEIAVESQRTHVDSVIEEGKKIISALTSSGETSSTTKKLSDTVDAVEERWASVKEELDRKRIKIRTASELHRLTGEAESMKRILFNHQKWLQGAETTIESTLPGKNVDVEKLVDQSRVRTRTMQLQNKKIEKMKQIISMVSDDDPDPVVQEAIKEVRSFINFWESINERNNLLVEKIKSRAKETKGELSPSSTRTPLVVSPDIMDGDTSLSPLMTPSPVSASSNRQERNELSLSPSLKETSSKTIDSRVSPLPPPLPPHNRPPVPPRPPHRPHPSHQQQQHQDNTPSESLKGYSFVTSRQDSMEKEKEKVHGGRQPLRMKHEESLETRSRDVFPSLPPSSRDKLISTSHELDEVEQEDHEESTLVKQHKHHEEEKIQGYSHLKKDDDGDQKEREKDKNVTRNSSSVAQVSRGIIIRNDDETEGRGKDEVPNQQQQQHRGNVQQELERRKDYEDNDSSPTSSLGDPGHEKHLTQLERQVDLLTLELDLAEDKLSTLLKQKRSINSTTASAFIEDPDILRDQLDQLREFSDGNIPDLHDIVRKVNELTTRLSAFPTRKGNLPGQEVQVILPHSLLYRVEEVNRRFEDMSTTIANRTALMEKGILDATAHQQNFLACATEPPFERSVAPNKVPYYINHDTETTQWDHPRMSELMNSLSDFNEVRYSAYRTGLKLRSVQKRLCLDLVSIDELIRLFDTHGLRGVNDKLISVPDMISCLQNIFEGTAVEHSALVNIPLSIDLCLNWLLNLYDTSSRTGFMRVLSFKIGLVSLCKSSLDDKYRFMFQLIVDHEGKADERKLGLLLHDLIQIPRILGEVASFGGSNIEPSVRSCFEKKGVRKKAITSQDFMEWLEREPQSIVWLPVMHRLTASETAKHQAKCNICKTYPMMGLRYRCLRCFNFDICQTCFLSGRYTIKHNADHPMQEYCTEPSSGVDVRDFSRIIRNKFKSKRYFKKRNKKGYLPVLTVLEGDDMESPSPATGIALPPPPSSQQPFQTGSHFSTSTPVRQSFRNGVVVEQHPPPPPHRPTQLGVGNRSAGSSFDSDHHPNNGVVIDPCEDEHFIVSQFSQMLASDHLRSRPSTSESNGYHRNMAAAASGLYDSVPPPSSSSPLQVMSALEMEQRDELEAIIQELEEENRLLVEEYGRLREEKTATGHHPSVLIRSQSQRSPSSPSSLPLSPQSKEEILLAEAKALRQHKNRLEGRMEILEDHNRQLESQLKRLRQLLEADLLAGQQNYSISNHHQDVPSSSYTNGNHHQSRQNGHQTNGSGKGTTNGTGDHHHNQTTNGQYNGSMESSSEVTTPTTSDIDGQQQPRRKLSLTEERINYSKQLRKQGEAVITGLRK